VRFSTKGGTCEESREEEARTEGRRQGPQGQAGARRDFALALTNSPGVTNATFTLRQQANAAGGLNPRPTMFTIDYQRRVF
jgi:hypothetical protein